MKRLLIIFLVFTSTVQFVLAQEDWSWWNDAHGWEPGDPGWRNWLIISPAYLGPNALPVPELKKGLIDENTQIELTVSNHFLSGDPTQDISGRIYIPFAQNKIAVEMYGVLFEHYAYTQKIRDERFSRDKNGKGYAFGDFYFSTHIQLFKDRAFPNTMFRVILKTASGTNDDGARYADTPAYSLDFSSSKSYGQSETLLFRPHAMLGFYCWQTNDELNLQNDALLYGAGADFQKKKLAFYSVVVGVFRL